MAARQRRRKTSRAARLTLVFAANALALALLWQILAGGEADVVAASDDAGRVLAALEVIEPSWMEGDRGRALESDLGRIVGRWIERARQRTGNKAHDGNVTVAVHVRELGGGSRAEVGFRADRSMRPASNMKLVTTAAALVLLGPNWSFDTQFEAVGPLQDGVLRGDLVVRAGGDSLFDPAAGGSVDHLLAPLVADLRARGLRAVQGDLVLDEGAFADPGPGPEWPDPGQHWAEYCALAGGFSANRGALTATVRAGSAGKPARVTVEPRDHGLVEHLGVRTAEGGRLTVAMHARSSGVLVRGSISAGAREWSDSMAHPDPVELFGSVLSGALARGGVLLEGRMRRERDAPAGRVLAHLRTSLVDQLAPINADSTNAVADQLFFATGNAVVGDGSRGGGAAATALALARLGVSSEGLVQVDGSGLSRANRVTAAQMTALIEAVLSADPQSGRAYLDSLALAGETGTLDERMREGPARARVRAKTGFIGGTSALSGVAQAGSGRSFVFSILVEYPNISGLNSSCWKPMQDEICELLVGVQP